MPIAMVALVSTVLGASAGAAVPGLDPDRVPWVRLRYEARKLIFKGTTEVRLAGPRGTLAAGLIASPRGMALEPGARVSLLELETAFVGRRSEAAVWFDPGVAFALQRRKLQHGRKAYEKTYRFTGGGVFVRRRSPRSLEEGRQPAQRWGRVEETFYSYPELGDDCRTVAEPTMLFYFLAAAEWAAVEPLAICTFLRRELSRVELVPAGAATLEVDYVELAAGERRRRQGEIEAVRVTVRARPVDGGGEFEFLGLEGDVEIFLVGGVPVEIRGRLPRLGRVRVKLVEVELRDR